MLRAKLFITAVAISLLLSLNASAAVIYDEAVDGDLSASVTLPTSVGNLSAGDQLIGTTSANGIPSTDQDSFWFTAQSPITGFLFEASNPFGEGFVLSGWGLREYQAPTGTGSSGQLGKFVGFSYLLTTTLLTAEYLTIDGFISSPAPFGEPTPLNVGKTYAMVNSSRARQPFSGTVDGFDWSITALGAPVPTPATLALLLFGLASLGYSHKRFSQVKRV